MPANLIIRAPVLSLSQGMTYGLRSMVPLLQRV